MPQRPYFPLGSLRQAIAYPMPADAVPTRIARGACGGRLAHLHERLDEEADWSVMLSGGEQQRVAFARGCCESPRCCCSTSRSRPCSTPRGHELYRMLIEQLPDTIILTIDRREVLPDLHTDASSESAAARRVKRPLTPSPA